MAFFIKVNLSSNQVETTTPDSDDDWDRASTSTDWTIHGISLSKADGYQVQEVPFKPEVGSVYHLLYAIYSTGDSFGHDDSACFEIIGVYDDPEIAASALAAAQSGGPLINELGKEYDSWIPWDGYFEDLVTLECKPMVLGVAQS